MAGATVREILTLPPLARTEILAGASGLDREVRGVNVMEVPDIETYVAPGEVLGSVFHRIGLDWGAMPAHPNGDAVLWDVRFPRVIMAVLVGAALGVAGALMQGVFGNPLAEPAVVGVA